MDESKTLVRRLTVFNYIATSSVGCANSKAATVCALDPASSHRSLQASVAKGFVYKQGGELSIRDVGSERICLP